ncbi:uncharacterized protein LAESUDRAFT_288405 [Laetiporus sulphureus 93-53]|uniref:Uncharacterized protein n=1 Tax=Laetiporus sulphureus 93-53 TaxID=1314785 RepID=A0A165DD81_9APHY|nr:uncharacterized protein LAESUDRAFT_288405 [Laetiporus sulphureus 93-53]KZT04612.1 hypothetical protein LAESUDRAFT_288405 [Laetiporus sulphureus 93-53]
MDASVASCTNAVKTHDNISFSANVKTTAALTTDGSLLYAINKSGSTGEMCYPPARTSSLASWDNSGVFPEGLRQFVAFSNPRRRSLGITVHRLSTLVSSHVQLARCMSVEDRQEALIAHVCPAQIARLLPVDSKTKSRVRGLEAAGKKGLQQGASCGARRSPSWHDPPRCQ